MIKIKVSADDLNAWANLLTVAAPLGQAVVEVLLHHAMATLDDAGYTALEARWSEDAARAAANAGIVPSADATSEP